MGNVSLEDIKKLREQLGTGMVDTKNALEEAGGDVDKAIEILRLKGAKGNAKRADRSTSEGLVAAHEGDGAAYLIELACETDFVAKNEIFRDFVKDVTLHIAASHPLYVNREEVPEGVIARERDIAAAQVQGKPANIVEKIVDGKVDKFYSTICLMEQAFIKNPEVSIKELVASKIAELGENIVIRRFTRYTLGESLA